jgi:hypothetical protein
MSVIGGAADIAIQGLTSTTDPKRALSGSNFRSAPKPGCERGFPLPLQTNSAAFQDILSVSTIATPRGGWVEPRWEQKGDNCRIPGTTSPEFRD